MNKENELQYYLSVSPNKYGIYLFDTKNLTNLYKEEIISNNDTHYENYDELKKFLDDNIFKIEKLSGKFIENIFLILEDIKIFNLEIGIKKKNYNISVTKEYLENLLIEAKDLFRENCQNQEIIHMIINKYFMNDETYSYFEEDLKSDYCALEINFKSISENTIYQNHDELKKFLDENIFKIEKLSGKFIENIFVILEDKKIFNLEIGIKKKIIIFQSQKNI